MKRLGIVVLFLCGLLLIVLLSFLLWASYPHRAEPKAYSEAMRDPGVVISNLKGFITIRPAGETATTGLLFYPGLKVVPEAYVSKLAAIAETADIQIAIGRPRLNVPALSINQADAMRSALPGVTHWYVGGHSMGGAMACLYASKNTAKVEGVVLLGTYCGSDLSRTRLRVLQISGDRDGVMPPAKIATHRAELPENSMIVTVSGMNHAQVGNYGSQPGDHFASTADETAERELADNFRTFFSKKP